MELDPEKVSIIKKGDALVAVIDGEERPIARVARAFPKTRPNRHVGLMDPNGREVGLIDDVDRLDPESKAVLEAELHRIYYVPQVQEVVDIQLLGTASEWHVVTDQGDATIHISDRSALDGSEAPAVTITDDDGKRYRIASYWALDDASRRLMRDLIPDKVRRSGRGRVMKRRPRRED